MTPTNPWDIPSPCIGVCRLNPRTARCDGCERTTEEIAAWPTMDAPARLALLKLLATRGTGGDPPA